jgi:hypothetical protein
MAKNRRKKNMKKATTVILILLLVIFLAACGGENPSNGNSSGVGNSNSVGGANNGSNAVETQAPNDLPETPANDFSYQYNAEISGIEITEYTGTSIRVRIPQMIEDVPVKIIGDRAFSGSGVMEIFIPENVVKIGSWAFSYCTGLTTITLPNQMNAIGSSAFAGCTGLTNITIPDSVIIIGSEAFVNCTNLTSITIPDSVTEIGDRAFAGCGLINIIIPASVVKIGSGAFSYCTGLTSLVYGGEIRAGILFQMDGYLWRVLEVQDNKALIISEDILENKQYHTIDTEITWADCSLRSYLNNDFYYSLSADTQVRINETQLANNDNPDYGTSGGANTTDKIFLLSIEEARTYLNDDVTRVALISSNPPSWWWLRSPGRKGNDVAGVHNYDSIDIRGNGSGVSGSGNIIGNGGVRPAMWINL